VLILASTSRPAKRSVLDLLRKLIPVGTSQQWDELDNDSLNELKNLSMQKKVVSIGEIGWIFTRLYSKDI
jgi:hypothetical protein